MYFRAVSLHSIVKTYPFSGNFPGKIFREFSEFPKFSRTFSEVFLYFPLFYNDKNITFRSVKLYVHEKPTGIFGKFSGKFPGFLKNRLCRTLIKLYKVLPKKHRIHTSRY